MLRPFIIILLLCYISGIAYAQPYTFQSYSLAEGLPQSQVWCALSDSRGFLWFGTQGGGLSRFDGLKFETFTTANSLPSNFILSLYQDRDYCIWVGTNKGLCYYNGHQFKTINGLEEPVRSIARHPNGQLLAGTNQGIYKIEKDSTRAEAIPIKESLDQAIIYKLTATEGRLWVGTSSGAWEVYPDCRPLGTVGEVFDMSFSKDTLWMAVYGKGIYGYTDSLFELSTDYSVRRTMCLYKSPVGPLYIGTQDQGLLRYYGSFAPNLAPVPGQNAMQNNVRDILLDQMDRLWITSSGGGVACRKQQNFQHYDREDGLAGNRVYAVHLDTAQQLWMSVSRKGLQIIDTTGFLSLSDQPPFPGTKCKTICGDSLGQVWVGSEGEGLAVLDSSGWFKLGTQEGLPSNWIVKLLADKNGNIWGATYSSGIFKVIREEHRVYRIQRFDRNAGLPDLRINALTLGPEGNVWFGTFSGEVGRIKKGRVDRLYTSAQGLPQATIRSLAFDDYGQIWAGSKGSGVFFAKRNEERPGFTRLSDIYSTISENVYLMVLGPEGNIWAGSESGVDKIELDSLGQVVQVQHYNRRDGFLGIETCHDAAITHPDGSIWFGTMNGLTHYRPGEHKRSCVVPDVHFTKVDLFYKPLIETAWSAYAREAGGIEPGLELPYRQNHLSFGFRAVSQIQAEEIRYRWKLEGAEADWSPPSEASSVNYANLPPGNYRFLIQASVDNCPWSPAITAPFAIAEPFWQASWFLPLVITLAILLISLIAWRIVYRVKQQEKAHRSELELQNRLLQLEQKALQLQMNPHFIFNALTGIQSLVATGEYSRARKRINEFAKLMRATLYNVRRPTITLREEIDTLERYLGIEQFCQAQPFTYTISLRVGIDTEEVELPPMLLQPFVENAVLHGVSHLQYPGEINISFEVIGDLLYVTIKDNGVGRERSAQLQQERKAGHQSLALKVTKERLEALKGERLYDSLKISDITDAKSEIKGTQVELILPIKHAY